MRPFATEYDQGWSQNWAQPTIASNAQPTQTQAFSIVIVRIALIAPGPGSRCKQSHKCGDALDEQLETVSAQIAPGAFQVARDQFASWNSNLEELTFRLCGVVFLLRPSH